MQWNPATLDEVDDEKIKLVFKPLEDDLELRVPETEENRFVLRANQLFCIGIFLRNNPV